MATKIFLSLLALFAAVSCNPLGQTTVCESSPNLPNFFGTALLPGYGSGATTVCESSPNLAYGYGLGLGPAGLGTVCESAPSLGLVNGLALGGLGYMGNLAETTTCSSAPTLGVLGGYGNLGYLAYPYGYGYGINGLGLSGPTVCESMSNVGLGVGLGLPVATAVCESTPNVISAYGLPGYGRIPGLAYGGLGGTTFCESAPMNLGYGHAFL